MKKTYWSTLLQNSMEPFSRPRARRKPYPYRRYPPRKTAAWHLYAILAGLVLLLLSIPVVLLGGLYLYHAASGRILPGVKIGTASYSGLARQELVQQIDTIWNGQPRIQLTDGTNTWPVTPIALGLWVDPQATADRALAFGRGENGLQEFFWLARFGQWSVEPVLVFDEDVARSGLEQASQAINRAAQDAALRFEGGEWIIVPAQTGSAVDIDTTLARIAANPRGVLNQQAVPLAMVTITPRVTNLAPVLEELRAALEQPLRLRAYDPISDETIEWNVPRETLAAWIDVEPQSEQMVINLDSQGLVAYLADWKSGQEPERVLEPFAPPDDLASLWRSGQPLDLMVRRGPSAYSVQPGDTLTRIAFKVGMPYWKIQQANPGIDPDALIAGQSLTIPSPNEMLPLPVVRGKRIVVSISQQHMWTYENGAQRSEHVISTGIDRSPTIPGVYQVQTHEISAYASVWDLTMPHFLGIYEGWPGFMNGFHGLPTLSNGRILWAGNLGRQVSYGCIILDLDEAENLYNWAENGVVVEIRP